MHGHTLLQKQVMTRAGFASSLTGVFLIRDTSSFGVYLILLNLAAGPTSQNKTIANFL